MKSAWESLEHLVAKTLGTVGNQAPLPSHPCRGGRSSGHRCFDFHAVSILVPPVLLALRALLGAHS